MPHFMSFSHFLLSSLRWTINIENHTKATGTLHTNISATIATIAKGAHISTLR